MSVNQEREPDSREVLSLLYEHSVAWFLTELSPAEWVQADTLGSGEEMVLPFSQVPASADQQEDDQ